jgi:hypothetical protein
MRLTFVTEDKEHVTYAPPGEQLYTEDNKPFVWIKTNGGEITRAYPTNEL